MIKKNFFLLLTSECSKILMRNSFRLGDPHLVYASYLEYRIIELDESSRFVVWMSEILE